MNKEGRKTNKVAGRFTKGSAPELVNSGFRMEVNDSELLYNGMSLADLAHAIMLIEIDLIPQDARCALISALLEMHSLPEDEIDFKNDLVDVYTNRTEMLYQRTPETAGWLQAGRPRREVSTLAYLIITRAELLEVIKCVLKLMEALLEFCEDHRSTLVPDYTYLQRAHPTTLAHYMLTFVQHMARDLDRMQSVYKRTNKSPACAGSTNGSRLPIDRELVAGLLGFKGLVVHTRDAMWQSDGPIELISSTLAILCNIDRLAEDLQIWATSEFNFIDLSESHSRLSVIMPQKKNPYSLAYIRGVAREMIGRLSGTAALQLTPSGQVDNRIFTYGMVPRGLVQTKEALKLFSATISSLKVNKDKMRLAALDSLVGSTDLAEEIMMRYGINAQAAHSIVGQAIRFSIQEGKSIKADLINDAAMDIINCSLNISDDHISQIMDPESIIETRTGPGGASSKSVNNMIADLRNKINDSNHWRTLEKSWLKRSEKSLVERAKSICQ